MMDRANDRGFTMVETLVALIVFCVIAAAVQIGLSATLRAARIAEGQEHALDHAKRLLAEVGISRPLVLGVQSGSIDDVMQWRIAVEPIAQTAAFAASDRELALYAVDVLVSWRDASSLNDRAVSLRTIKLGGEIP